MVAHKRGGKLLSQDNCGLKKDNQVRKFDAACESRRTRPANDALRAVLRENGFLRGVMSSLVALQTSSI